MPKAKYEQIYRSIRDEITGGTYAFGEYLPSENEYTERFDCTRNTIRRAISILTSEGYLLPRHGKGVQVIYQPEKDRSIFTVGGIESFAEANRRNKKSAVTEVIEFRRIKADRKTSRITGFPAAAELYYIERVRIIGGRRLIFDTNYFLASETPGLTEETASRSIYSYLENDLHMTITTSRRRVTAEKATEKDLRLLDLGTCDFVLVVTGQVFNAKGVMFEYTQSRHCPEDITFIESAVRQKIQ